MIIKTPDILTEDERMAVKDAAGNYDPEGVYGFFKSYDFIQGAEFAAKLLKNKHATEINAVAQIDLSILEVATEQIRKLESEITQLKSENERLKGKFNSVKNVGCDATCKNYCHHEEITELKEQLKIVGSSIRADNSDFVKQARLHESEVLSLTAQLNLAEDALLNLSLNGKISGTGFIPFVYALDALNRINKLKEGK